MKIPLSWLNEFLSIPVKVEEASTTLTSLGIEVESAEALSFGFENIAVAQVISSTPHPTAAHLQVAVVSDGIEPFQIVCGAPNCRAGLKTALAKIGATLTDEEGKKWQIKKARLREIDSFGMLCSEKELGLSDSHEKILELDPTTPLGLDIKSLFADWILEISLTPNLSHCLSVLGIARELSAALKIPIKMPLIVPMESKADEEAPRVEIVDREKCPRYACRLVTNVLVRPSPFWLRKKIEAAGLRSINNVVDVANFVMLSLGHPLHFFDAEKIAGKQIRITSLTHSTNFLGLDEKEYALSEGALVICDENKPLAVAGIIGGKESCVTDTTRHVLIESAYFSPSSIRRTSKLLGLKTEASLRYERGTDIQIIPLALHYATLLLEQIANGTAVGKMVDAVATAFTPKRLILRVAKTEELIGVSLSIREIAALLHRLDFKILEDRETALYIEVPSYRNDISLEVDLIEEVARLYGYAHLPLKRPYYVDSSIGHSPIYLFEKRIRENLLREGLQEWISCDLTSPSLVSLTEEKAMSSERIISVLHSHSIDQSVLRPSLLPTLLGCVQHNFARQFYDLAVFEVGRIHYREKGGHEEPSSVAILLTGKKRPYHWNPPPSDWDFFDLKGILENLLRTWKIAFHTAHLHSFHPHCQCQIKIEDRIVGSMGELHPALMRALNMERKIYYAELQLQEILALSSKGEKVEELFLFPKMERDWTVTVRRQTPVELLIQSVQAFASPLLSGVYLLGVYTSEELGREKKNVTLRLSYRHREKTLDFQTVEKEHAKIVKEVAEKLSNDLC